MAFRSNVEEAAPFPRFPPSRSPSPSSSSRDHSATRDTTTTVHPSESVFGNNLVVSNPASSNHLATFAQSSEYEPGKTPQIVSMVQGPVRGLSNGLHLPFLFSNNFTPEISEKYQQLMKKKQKKAKKSGEKNVKAVKKSEEVEGYEGDKDVNTLLRSLGEAAEEVTKRPKVRRAKAERIREDKKRKSQEKSSEDEEGKEEEEEEQQQVEDRGPGKVNGLHNGNISTPEPAELSRLKSSEALAGSTESLNFTKVTNKKNRSRRKGEETGRPPPAAPPGPPPGRTSYYALRSRDVAPVGRAVSSRGSGTVSPVESLPDLHHHHHHHQQVPPPPPPPAPPAVLVEVNSLLDFPALRPPPEDTGLPFTGGAGRDSSSSSSAAAVGGGGSNRSSAWSARLTSSKQPAAAATQDTTHQQDHQACDIISAVIDSSDSSSTSAASVVVPPPPPPVQQQHSNATTSTINDNTSSSFLDTSGGGGETSCSSSSNNSSRNIFEENISRDDIISDSSSCSSSSVRGERRSSGGGGGGGVVFDTKSCCLAGPTTDQNANFLSEMVELEFGFELNPELLKSFAGETTAASNEQQQQQERREEEPVRSIGSMDAAILSFGPAGPGGGAAGSAPLLPPGLAPMVIPVGVPFGMFPATGLPAYLPFPIMHQVEQYPGTHLSGAGGGGAGEEEEVGGGVGGGDTVVSPESGISSASPLSSPSLHPDSSPVLQPRPTQEESCQMLEQVNTSLEAWRSGHSPSSCSPHSSARDSPHGWATQVDMSFGTGEEEVVKEEEVVAAPAPNCSNYREIVSYVQQSWSILAADSQLKVYRDSPRPLLQ